LFRNLHEGRADDADSDTQVRLLVTKLSSGGFRDSQIAMEFSPKLPGASLHLRKVRNVAVSALSIERKFGNFIRVHSAYNVTSSTYLVTCSSPKINYALKKNLGGKEIFLESRNVSGNARYRKLESINSIIKEWLRF
jgi:hypothetical protein